MLERSFFQEDSTSSNHKMDGVRKAKRTCPTPVSWITHGSKRQRRNHVVVWQRELPFLAAKQLKGPKLQLLLLGVFYLACLAFGNLRRRFNDEA